MNKRIYIIGYGYIGHRIAAKAIDAGYDVFAFSRTNARPIQNEHFHVNHLDLDDGDESALPIPAHADVFYLAPPPGSGIVDTRVTEFLHRLSDQSNFPRRIVYFSATGVYGDCAGEWIDEERALNPQADRSKRRVDAENQLKTWCEQVPTDYVIIRVAGIYGPGRLPLERLAQGMKVLEDNIAPASNRIHADDLADIALAAMQKSPTNQVYNAADGNPTSMTDYFTRVASAYNLPPPQRIDMDQAKQQMSPQMMSYLIESKRLNNTKMLSLLDQPLRFPTLDDGLIQCRESD